VSVGRRRHRLAVGGLAVAGLIALGSSAAGETAAALFEAFQAKSTDPVQVEAELLEIYEEGEERVSVFSGNVVVRRGDTTMRAATIKLYSALESTAADAFTRIEAGGKVRVQSGPQTVTGERAVVDMRSRTITVSGGVVLSQGNDVISGSRLVVNLETGRARIEQAPGQQIRGVFTPGGPTARQLGQ
jgi:lipopolysaccharide export system protein LptA